MVSYSHAGNLELSSPLIILIRNVFKKDKISRSGSVTFYSWKSLLNILNLFFTVILFHIENSSSHPLSDLESKELISVKKKNRLRYQYCYNNFTTLLVRSSFNDFIDRATKTAMTVRNEIIKKANMRVDNMTTWRGEDNVIKSHCTVPMYRNLCCENFYYVYVFCLYIF